MNKKKTSQVKNSRPYKTESNDQMDVATAVIEDSRIPPRRPV